MSGLSTARILQRDTHRLIPTKYSEGSEVARIAKDTRRIPGILDLDLAPYDRSVDGNDRLFGNGIDGLASGVPRSAIINAAFAHAKPQGGRFNLPNRGAWYAGFALETSKAEIAWHKSLYLHEIDRTEENVAYDDYLADFGGVFHDIRADPNRRKYLDPDSYVESQSLAKTLFEQGSPGIIYPSVRHDGGVCIACFRPALVGNVRKSARYRFTWSGSFEPIIELEAT